MYERRSEPLIPRHEFLVRIALSSACALVLIALSLLIGIVGYHSLENLGWMDSFLNAAMLLGGMGPIHVPVTEGGKLFAGIYAIYCGLIVILAAGLLLAPVAHRMLHFFHLESGRK